MGSVVCRISFVILVLTTVSVAAQPPTPSKGKSAPAGTQTVASPAVPADGMAAPGQGGPSIEELAARVLRIPKQDAVLVGADRVKGTGIMQQEFQLIGEEGAFYLVRMLPPEDPKSPLHRTWMAQQVEESLGIARAAYMADKYMITGTPDITPPFIDKLEFERRDTGLPKSGHWQMSFDIADMNGDGRLDLVLPPPRLGVSHPSIFLQQADGSWRLWSDVRWPQQGVKLDYGTVRVADFDGDGHPDIALASHFSHTYVLYGDGKGGFTRFVELPRANKNVSARSLVVADFNNDGRPDVATLGEIDLDIATNQVQHTGLVNVFLNLKDGWKTITEGFPTEIQGDWLSAADIDRDGWTDLLLTSRKEGVTSLFMRNVGKGERFQAIAEKQVPYSAFVFANAGAPLDRFKSPDVVLCFEEFNGRKIEDPTQACVIYHFHDAKGKPTLTPHQDVIFKTKVAYDNFKGVAVGDIDGDGRNDIAVISSEGERRIFLQYSDGKFYEERSPEIKIENTDLFDVRIADLSGDGMGDVIVMGSPKGSAGGGGVWVFHPRLKYPPKTAARRSKP